ncbi:hypothetical protein [Bacillus suaedaesalsae]|uniref:DUF4279 domain-containing protein n=1 Tax=Bacillus suaedaesalsae TaxID=2810349 RepID=A0ABS2DF50_9BACI|nr:hypothetical protein [Bacillus suaedaesalsae]MBM6617091.1 hypothetical protein [Bacillus suaedaesalsae]
MIKEMDIRCHLFGENFSPKKLKEFAGIVLENRIEVGDELTKGRFKGKPSPEGYGVLCPPIEYRNSDDFGLHWVAQKISKHQDDLQKCGVVEIKLVIGVFYEGQCNFVLEPKAIGLIGELGIPLEISCYHS